MVKRKEDSTSNTFDNNKKQKAKLTTQSSLASWVKTQPQEQTRSINIETLFSKVGEETKEILGLELETMNSEWLKALSEEIRKPYFIEVHRPNRVLMKFLYTRT